MISQPTDIAALARRIEVIDKASWRSMYEASPPDVAVSLGLGCAEEDGVLRIWNRSAPSLLFNRLLGLGVDAPATDAMIDALLERTRTASGRAWVQVAPIAEPGDLASRLEARGLRHDVDWAMHYHTLEGELPAPVGPDGYRIERVAPETTAAWADALLAGWRFPASSAAGALALVLPLAQHPDWICYAAIDETNDRVVAGGSLFIAGGVAELHNDGTRSKHRQRGLHAALIATRLSEARRRGCQQVYATTLTDHSSQRNMARAGFEVAYVRPNYVVSK
jgi:hypothetical protein